MATSFQSPVLLVHSLKTGLLSPHQRSVSRLTKGIEEDMKYLKNLSKDVHVAVTWDASINACVHRDTRSQDCSLNGQLWQAADREPTEHDNEETLNHYTADFGNDILRELKSVDISAWFFRTAKLQSIEGHGRSDVESELWKFIKRRQFEPIVSGNDFLAMYNNGMFSKSLLSPMKHRKGLATPVAIGLGILGGAGAGALGWWFWDDIKIIGKDVVQFFEKLQKVDADNKKPAIVALDSKATSQVVRLAHSVFNSPPATPDELISPFAIAPPGWTEEPLMSVAGDFPFSRFPKIMSVSQDHKVIASEPIEPLEPYTSGEIINLPPGFSTRSDSAWGLVDKTKHPPVEEIIEHWSAPPVSEVELNEAALEASQLSNRGSVAASVARFETPLKLSPIDQSPRNSFHSTGSEFHLSKEISSKDSHHLRPLSDIQRDLEASGVPEEQWVHGIAVAFPRRPGSGLQDSASKRHGKVISIQEQEDLNEMLNPMRVERRQPSVVEKVVRRPQSGPREKIAGNLSGQEIQNEKKVEDASIVVPPLQYFLIPRYRRTRSTKFHQRDP